MLDISVIILTYNEEIHIRRCIENVLPFAREVFVVDSCSTDATVDIARALGAEVYAHDWPGNQAAQFNWALDNLPIKSEWVLRLDADEYLLPDLITEMQAKVPQLPCHVTGVELKRRHIFMERWMRRGTYPVKILRLFRYGKAVCEQRLMDEHICLLEGICVTFDNDFCDHNLHNLTWWITKHNGYAIREAVELLDIEFNLFPPHESLPMLAEQAAKKRIRKQKYARMPLFWRTFMYFFLRYIVKGGFLEGKEGFLWHFLQGWWYRTLVDAKIFEIKKACGDDREKIKEYIRRNYNIILE